jgi:predicted O-methyltransferase YrrM
MTTKNLDKYTGLKEWGWYMHDFSHIKAHLAAHLPLTEKLMILEIGAFDGIGTNMLLDEFFTNKETVIFTVDPFLPDETTPQVNDETRVLFVSNLKAGGHKKQINLLAEKSEVALPGLIERELKFDFIYVDGSHKEADVRVDAKNAWELLKVGGVIGFDDYLWTAEGVDGPKKAIDEFEAEHKDQLQLLYSDWQRWYKRIA